MVKGIENFLDLEKEYTDIKRAKVVILPVPYERTVTFGIGTSKGPYSIIFASRHLELYDETLNLEPYRVGIATFPALSLPDEPYDAINTVYESTKALIQDGKFVVSLGGEHTISVGFCKALVEIYPSLCVIQLDAHADLRENFCGSPYNHACTMARIREYVTDALQIGIRSMSSYEAEIIYKRDYKVFTMDMFRSKEIDLEKILDSIGNDIFLTIDVDAFDWSVIRSTGTPEPGGFLWGESLHLLSLIFRKKNVVGFDIVELTGNGRDINSSFAAAKLVYKLIGFKFFAKLNKCEV
ncbi:MAG: agmatinase [Thermodesulfobacteriota bacterium]|nr:agmatinase [Thermodesulfobacteriota bacterium]